MAMAAQGAQLTSVQSSYHSYGGFALLVLRFDQDVAHQIESAEGGRVLLITLPGCILTPQAATELTAVRNDLQKGILTSGAAGELVLRLEFTRAIKFKGSDTYNPRCVILDFSPADDSPSSEPVKQTEPLVKKPPEPIKKSEASSSSSTRSKGSAQSYANLGKQALADKRESQAIEYLTKALRLAPDHPEAHYLLGLMQRKWGQPESAIPHFQKAKADPVLVSQACMELASIYRQLGRTAEEVAEWEMFFAVMKKFHALPDSLTDLVLPDSAETLPEDNESEFVAPTTPVLATQDSLKSVVSTTPVKSESVMVYVLSAVVALLAGVIILLYVKQRELQRTINLLMVKDEERDFGSLSSTSARPASSEPPPQLGMEPARPVPLPESRGADETAREVLGLYKAGMSIQGIAEKLAIGQDEVKLILNLQRSETKT
jgi:tetratricopeptide (TPR) repeat protein